MVAAGELVADALVVRRGGRAVVDRVSLEVEPYRVVAVSGPSGAGKTTLLSVLAGVLPSDGGTLTFAGAPVKAGDHTHLARVGFVPQTYGLVAVLTAAENIEVALRVRGVGGEEARERAVEALARVGLDEMADRLVGQLSGGQRQRAAVARGLGVLPDLLIADEPTSELDGDNRDVVVAALQAEAARGAAVVVATHDPEVAERADSVVELHDGKVVA
jgi:putative ABC transport system ATP-binding protein